MSDLILQTSRLTLQLSSIEQAREMLAAMPAEMKSEVSADWLARIEAATVPSPWIHGFRILQTECGSHVGDCGFKAPPDAEGAVEIAYSVESEYQNQGFATEATSALTDFALGCDQVTRVRAHTLPHESASTRVLSKCGFSKLGEVMDPDDGLVWRWEKTK